MRLGIVIAAVILVAWAIYRIITANRPIKGRSSGGGE